ncbi:hypothetical protein KVT40_004359 [Elsinoe batatas]|uniref:Uncharacterized protein n=1 Tax=Elsinoe batatas TaxID=2601811 RepID=A0A8K0PG18_9PEZI|nr:hypothetical protein KVT40_004359 [Elsinoe batatas]
MAALRCSSLLALAALFALPAHAQDQDFTVWSSFIFLRTGERTPSLLTNLAPTLTSLGAQQMYSAGQYFRSQYLEQGSTNRIEELDDESPRTDQVYALTLDSQYTSASTQSFLLGMWPPINNASADTEGIPNQLANGTVIQNPAGGVNLPRISTAGVQDIDSLYVGGDIACPGFGRYASSSISAARREQLIKQSQSTYDSLAPILDPVLNRSLHTIDYAKSIYDYVSYQNNYNSTVSQRLSTDSSLLDRLRYYADAQQQTFYANLTAPSPYNRQPMWARRGSISTIAGSGLAARISSHFYALQYAPSAAYRLSILVGDYAPLLSLISLTNLSRYPSFSGLPLPASALAIELISPSSASANITATGLPPPSLLSVRLRFRNGTGITGTQTFPASGGDADTYAVFDRANEDVDIPFNDFLAAMSDISISDPGDWCYQCAAQTLFCAAWNSSNVFSTASGRGGTSVITRQQGLSNEAAGGIGAGVALAVAGLVALLLWFVVGVRAHRTEPLWVSRKRRSELGGFKGSRKLASDADLAAGQHVVKDGTVVGAVIEKRERDGEGHARVGSWELRDQKMGGVQGQGQGNELGDQRPWTRHGRVESDGTLVDRDMGRLGLDGAAMGWGSRDEGDHVGINGARGTEERRLSADSGRVDPFRDPEGPEVKGFERV